MTTSINENLALRLGLSAKAIPSLKLETFINTLIRELGTPLSEKKLRKLDAKALYKMLRELGNDINRSQSNHAFAILTHPTVSAMDAPQVIESTPLKGPTLRVAISSNSEENIDGHFGSCLRMLVYDVNGTQHQLVDVRSVNTHENGLARTDYLIDLINDCHFLATLSIGGPAAAKVTRADIHPIKQTKPEHASQFLNRLTEVLAGTPPKWIQKILDRQEN